MRKIKWLYVLYCVLIIAVISVALVFKNQILNTFKSNDDQLEVEEQLNEVNAETEEEDIFKPKDSISDYINSPEVKKDTNNNEEENNQENLIIEDPEVKFASSFSLNCEEIIISRFDKVILNDIFQVEPVSQISNIEYEIRDSKDNISFDFSKQEIIALSVGDVYVDFKIKSGENEFLTASLKISVVEKVNFTLVKQNIVELVLGTHKPLNEMFTTSYSYQISNLPSNKVVYVNGSLNPINVGEESFYLLFNFDYYNYYFKADIIVRDRPKTENQLTDIYTIVLPSYTSDVINETLNFNIYYSVYKNGEIIENQNLTLIVSDSSVAIAIETFPYINVYKKKNGSFTLTIKMQDSDIVLKTLTINFS